jgi:hypothetical protein
MKLLIVHFSLDSCDPEQGEVAVCEHGNELLYNKTNQMH